MSHRALLGQMTDVRGQMTEGQADRQALPFDVAPFGSAPFDRLRINRTGRTSGRLTARSIIQKGDILNM